MKIMQLCMLLLTSLALSAQADGHKADQAAESEEGVLSLQQIAQALIAESKSLQEVVDAKVTWEDFDRIYGPESASAVFINRVYTSLTR